METRGSQAGKVLNLANEMRLVGIAVAKRQRCPVGARRAIGGAQ